MTDEVMQQEEQSVEVNEVEVLRKQLAEAHKSIEALAAKKEELYKETKAAKAERQRQAEIAEQARKEQLSIAEKNGEFEKLWKQEQETRTKLEHQLQQDRKDRRKEKLDLEAIKIAGDLAKDSDKAALLKVFVANSLSNVADDYGNVDADVVNGIRQQFESDKLYASLRAGNQSVGGSAPGNTRSAGNIVNELTFEQFSKLSPAQQLEFSRAKDAGKARILK